MFRHIRLLALATLAMTSAAAFAADPEDLGARPHVAPRQNLDQDGPPISRSDSFLRRGELRILDPGPSLIDPPPRSREAWQRLVERDLDRVMGRIEPEELFQLRKIEQDRAARFERIDPRRDFERFEEERDRTLRLEQRSKAQAQSIARERQTERESDRLKADRERWLRSIRGGTSAAVAADTRMLLQLKRTLDADLVRIEVERASALRAIDDNATLTPDRRAAERAAVEQRFTETRAQRLSDYDQRRATILGHREEGGR